MSTWINSTSAWCVAFSDLLVYFMLSDWLSDFLVPQVWLVKLSTAFKKMCLIRSSSQFYKILLFHIGWVGLDKGADTFHGTVGEHQYSTPSLSGITVTFRLELTPSDSSQPSLGIWIPTRDTHQLVVWQWCSNRWPSLCTSISCWLPDIPNECCPQRLHWELAAPHFYGKKSYLESSQWFELVV